MTSRRQHAAARTAMSAAWLVGLSLAVTLSLVARARALDDGAPGPQVEGAPAANGAGAITHADSEPPEAAELTNLPWLHGPAYRTDRLPVYERIFTTGFAIPAGVGGWDGADWLATAAVGTTTVGLMWPAGPSADVRLERWLARKRGGVGDDLFIHARTIPITIGIAAFTATTAGIGWAADSAELLEYTELMIEALGVAQTYHLVFKLLLGRQSPYQGNGQGDMHSLAKVSFPGGTPSGHALSMYVIGTVAAYYWDTWYLHVLSHMVGLYFAAALTYSGQHFVSDVVWGGAMGYAVARWTVRHRSSRYVDTEGGPVEVDFMPVPIEGGGGAVVMVGRF